MFFIFFICVVLVRGWVLVMFVYLFTPYFIFYLLFIIILYILFIFVTRAVPLFISFFYYYQREMVIVL